MRTYLYLAILIISFLSVSPKLPEEPDLVIETTSKGAELLSLKYKGKEYLYDRSFTWEQSSPVLFPIVGRLRDGHYMLNGNTYNMSIHGFANYMEFEKLGEHSYKLTSNEDTLAQYPFEFELYVTYKIDKNKLCYNYTVVNTNPDETMLFGIGGHPGFKCDYYKEKCEVEFEEEEDNIKVLPIDATVGLMTHDVIDGKTVLVDKKYLKIKKDSFKNDAIVFTDIKSKNVFLKDDGKKILKFNREQFKYLGVWSAVGEAPYVCLEPWYDLPDFVNSTMEFTEKEGIIHLEPNKKFEVGFSVEILDNDGDDSTSDESPSDSDSDSTIIPTGVSTNLKSIPLLMFIGLLFILI